VVVWWFRIFIVISHHTKLQKMDYSKLQPKFENQKLVFDNTKVWYPTESTKNGYRIGDTVFHINTKHHFLTEFKIVVNGMFTEYDLSEPCKLFGQFRTYKNWIERVSLKPIEGTWSNGNNYHVTWFNSSIEFPFDFIVPNSDKVQEFRKASASSLGIKQ